MSHEAPLSAAANFHDVSNGGQKFLMLKAGGGDPTSTLTGIFWVLSWLEELKASAGDVIAAPKS